MFGFGFVCSGQIPMIFTSYFFANNHSDFIEQVNQSFDSMLKNYHVKMPISEIAYLYEYIADDEDERKVASDDEF